MVRDNLVVSGFTTPATANGTYIWDSFDEVAGYDVWILTIDEENHYKIKTNDDEFSYWVIEDFEEENTLAIQEVEATANNVIGAYSVTESATGSPVVAWEEEEEEEQGENPNGTGGYGDERGSAAKTINLVTTGTGYGSEKGSAKTSTVGGSGKTGDKDIVASYIDKAYMGANGVAVDVS